MIVVLSNQWKTTDGNGEEPHMTTLSALTLSIHLNKVILDREKESLKHLPVADFLSPFALCLISGVGGGLNKSPKFKSRRKLPMSPEPI